MKVESVLFQDSKALMDNLTEMGGVYLVMWTVLFFQLFGHFNILRPAVTFKQLLNSIFLFHDLCPSKPRPSAQIEIDMRAHAQICTA